MALLGSSSTGYQQGSVQLQAGEALVHPSMVTAWQMSGCALQPLPALLPCTKVTCINELRTPHLVLDSRQRRLGLDAHGLTQGSSHCKHASDAKTVLNAEASLCDGLVTRAQALWLDVIEHTHVGTMSPSCADW